MRLYRLGDEGPAVRDIQDRLANLGHESAGDTRGVFGAATTEAVKAFQRSKGLQADGIVGPDTWRSLYEAGYRLGDRLLFMRRPMMRGEDVAELQSRLSALGFDTGKVDGIYGPDTAAAVAEFQRNRNLAEDGRAGPEVVTEIHIVTRGVMRESRHAVREREWLRRLPPTMAGVRIYLDAGCRHPDESRQAWEAATAAAIAIQEAGGLPLMSRSQDASIPERVRARRANRLGTELIVAFRLDEEGENNIFYFQSDLSASTAGQMLATSLAGAVGGVVEGRATALLKDTRAPAVVVSRGQLDEKVGIAVAEGLAGFFRAASSQT